MKNHAAAAASTLMALISTAESFISTPTGSASIGRGNRVTAASASTPCSVGRVPPGCTPASLEVCCRVGGIKRRRGTGALRLQAKGGRAAGAAAATEKRQHQQDAGSKLSSAEGAIDGKRQGEVEQLKKKLQHFASLRMWRQAATAFDKAKADGLPITASTYTFAINAMSKGGRWKEAIALLEEMIAGGPKFAPTVVSYNSAITACARCNKMPAALRLLAEMSSRSGLTPDPYSYAAVMSGLAKARNPKRALELLEEMRAAGVKPDVVCLASAMEACESKGAPQEAAEVLEQVRALDPPPSTSALAGILTSAIAACVAEGAWEQATDWLTDVRMANGGGLPSAAAYAAAACACARAGQGVRARALIAELESGGNGSGNGEAQRPTLECYNAVVLGCAMAGDMKGAVETLKVEVPKAGLKPDTEGFNHVIQGYAKLKDWRMALTFLDEQRSGNFPNAPPNRLGYNAAMDACGRAGQVQAAVALLDAMRAVSLRSKRLRPDRYTYGGALRACREAGDDDTALRLLEGMKKDGVRADQQCSLAAFSVLISAGREDDAAGILEGMVQGNVGTSEGAVAAAREGLTETLAAGGGGGGSQEKFARVFAALNALDEERAKKAAAKAERVAAEEEEAAAAAAAAADAA